MVNDRSWGRAGEKEHLFSAIYPRSLKICCAEREVLAKSLSKQIPYIRNISITNKKNVMWWLYENAV